MYGTKFDALWANKDLTAVKEVWAHDLSKFSLQTLAEAIKRLESPFPPSLPEFIGICRQVKGADRIEPSHQMFPKLEDRGLLIDSQAKVEFDKARADHNRNKFPGLDWADELRVKHAMGEKLSMVQIQLYQTSLKMQA